MNITGSVVASSSDDEMFTYADNFTSTGALSVTNRRTDKGGIGTTYTGAGYNGISLNAKDGWTGETSEAGTHKHTVTIGDTGSGTAMSLVQPSKAVARWLRTA